jgi:hypothetical protein
LWMAVVELESRAWHMGKVLGRSLSQVGDLDKLSPRKR